METIRTDVAIVGAGGAGLRAAIALAETDPALSIALVSKVYPMRSHTCAAEGGAAGVIKPDDSLEHHFNDTVGGGDWLCDQDAVDYLVQEAPKELIQLEHWGCPWNREPNGAVAVRPFGGMKKQRTWFAADKSGFHILHTLFQTSLQFSSIRRFDEYYATELLVEEGRCAGRVAGVNSHVVQDAPLVERRGRPARPRRVLDDLTSFECRPSGLRWRQRRG